MSDHPLLRRWLTLVLTGTLATAAGCGDEPVAPLPVRPPAPSPPAPSIPAPPSGVPASVVPSTAAPTVPSPAAASRSPRTATAPTTPPRRPTPRVPASTTGAATTAPSACLGAVRYDLELAHGGPLPSSLCFTTGGVLRIKGIGPGEVTVDRADLVDSNYEAGVVDLRFVRPGTVDVSIPRPDGTHVITVVVR